MSAPNYGPNNRAIQNFNPQQMDLFNQMISRIGGGAGKGIDYLSKLAGGDEDIFKQIEAPAYAGFDKLLGGIGSRFADVGAVGSSAFQNATSGAASNFAQELQGKRSQLQQSAIERLLGLSNDLLQQKPYGIEQKSGGFDWGSILGTLAGSAGAAFGGPIGGAVGKIGGDWIGKKFSGGGTRGGGDNGMGG